MIMLTPERHLPRPGQHGQSLQRHTAAGTAAPTTAEMGKHSPTARQPFLASRNAIINDTSRVKSSKYVTKLPCSPLSVQGASSPPTWG